MYYVYIVQCVDGTLYTGISNNIERRIKEHNTSKRGARYTSTRRPVVLLYSKPFKNRSLAQQAEAHIKTLSRQQKLQLISV